MHVNVTYFIANLEAYARLYNVHTSLLPPDPLAQGTTNGLLSIPTVDAVFYLNP